MPHGKFWNIFSLASLSRSDWTKSSLCQIGRYDSTYIFVSFIIRQEWMYCTNKSHKIVTSRGQVQPATLVHRAYRTVLVWKQEMVRWIKNKSGWENLPDCVIVNNLRLCFNRHDLGVQVDQPLTYWNELHPVVEVRQKA